MIPQPIIDALFMCAGLIALALELARTHAARERARRRAFTGNNRPNSR